MAEYIKVILNNSDKHFIVYIDKTEDWTKFLGEIEALFPDQDLRGLRKYWTDHEMDKIDIVDEKSYKIFLRMSTNKKIYLESMSDTFSPKPDESVFRQVHANVQCDSCEKCPIIGFRYKCVQCPDFDLCGECESKRIHKEHVMFRFPAPIKHIPFNLRFLRKMKKGCFIHSEGEEGATSKRHGRRHCQNNIFSSLYTMMQDMAEGTEGPTADDDESGPSDVEAQKTEKKHTKHNESTPRARKCKRHDVPQIDPSYLKAGVEILGNFSEMFSKMINPTAPADIAANGEQTTRPPAQKESDNASNVQNVEVLDVEVATEDGVPSRPSAEQKTTDDASKGKNIIGQNKSGGLNDYSEKDGNNPNVSISSEGASALVSDQPSTSKQTVEPEKDESDWTVINPPGVAPRRDSTNSSSSGASRKSGNQRDSADYAKISKDLYEHLQREEIKAAAAAKVEAPPQPPVQTDTRAIIVYHKDKQINNAVHAMMGMGFSNEGNWLTYLLESVNGDIAQAIDLMKPVK